MSSVSSIFGGSSLYSYLQNLSATTQSQTASPATATTDIASATAASGASSGQDVQGTHHKHGHGKGGQSQLFQQIQQAVTTALQSAQQSGSINPNQTIADAIESVFKNQAARASQPAAAVGQTPAADGDAAGSSTGGARATSASGAGNSSATQAFLQSLQSLGINPQQFHQDFLNAVQSVQNGNNVDPSTLFQSVPVGSILDTTG